MNIICVICSELFIPGEDFYFTQCGHVFHYHCLINWLERSKTCPQCRNRASEKTIHKVFFNFCNKDSTLDATTLMYKLENVNFTLSLKEKEIKNINEAKLKLKEQTRSLREEIAKLENNGRGMESTVLALKEQISYFKSKSKESDRLAAEILRLKNKIKDMENVEVVINGTRDQVNDILREEQNTESLALLTATLKKALLESEKKVRDLDHNLKRYKHELSKHKKEYSFLESQNADIRRDLQQIKMKSEKEKTILKQRITAAKNSSIRNNIVVANPDAGLENISLSKLNESHPKTSQNEEDFSVYDTTFSVAERVETIVTSDSPYLPVKKNFGSFLDTKFQVPATSLSSKPSSDPLNKGYSIFKSNQKLLLDGNSAPKNSEVAYNGLGGSSKEDIYPSPKKVKTGIKRTKLNSSVSSAKFKKLAPIPGKWIFNETFKHTQE